MASPGAFLKYVKKAFLYHWNLLAMGAGVAIGIISAKPDIVFPLIIAGELVFLAALSTRPKFQAAIDAEELKKSKTNKSVESTRKAEQILLSLGREDRERFKELKDICVKLQQISIGVKSEVEPKTEIVGDLQNSAINKLLWLYLRLLYSKNALERFFETIDEQEIQRDIEHAKERLDSIGPQEEDTPDEVKRRKLIADTLGTSEARLKNYRKALENYELIELELERLSSKIASLSEMSINWHDQDFITGEIDSVTASIQQTEKVIGELDFMTDLTPLDDVTPTLLDMN
jgi:hypothetical protein